MILTDPEWQAVLLSLKVSSLAVLFSLPFGIFFAWLLVRCKFPGKALLDSVLHLPLVLPPVVVGYLLLVAMGRRVFMTITLPLMLPGIIVGTVLAFARSLGEFGATITFVSNIPGETRTIPSAMYTLIQTPGGESAAARLCIISIVLALISLLISEWLARISRERTGR
ncbi:molybdate ABC transporter permease protein [Citrobacter youngae]|uniref:ABC transporter permease subunit n=1 Tax=Citrobacter youngae TaxID=133448 RepID=UPI000F519105|nr:ABC transporter permease subunit [Citrobacter youngae]RPH25687.1 ABC transporter permease subunit [Citrobacter youngae]VEI42728.1 molybdate ABC transporter permease protein [Citrobacter youngae]